MSGSCTANTSRGEDDKTPHPQSQAVWSDGEWEKESKESHGNPIWKNKVMELGCLFNQQKCLSCCQEFNSNALRGHAGNVAEQSKQRKDRGMPQT